MGSRRWSQRPEGSTWGDFGPEDQLGRLNLVTSKKVLQGIAEVKHGITFCLSLPLDYPGGAVLNPRRTPPELRPTVRNGKPNMTYPLRCDDPTATDVVCDDQVVLTLQYPRSGTAWRMSDRPLTPMATARLRTSSTTGFAPARILSAPCVTTRLETQPLCMRHLALADWAWRTWHGTACRAVVS